MCIVCTKITEVIKAGLLNHGSLCKRIVECLYKLTLFYIVILRIVFLVGF